MNAVLSNTTACNALYNDTVARNAIFNSSTALTAIEANSTALTALKGRANLVSQSNSLDGEYVDFAALGAGNYIMTGFSITSISSITGVYLSDISRPIASDGLGTPISEWSGTTGDKITKVCALTNPQWRKYGTTLSYILYIKVLAV